MKTAVIYARYSSSHQREESIEGQLRECMDFAEKNEYKVIGSYIDRALSAKTDARPQFQQMILDSAKGAFNYVIVYQLDRFARNRYDSATYKAKLKKNGVRLLSAKENITADPAGIILESVLEGMAEYYSAELAQKVKRGMTENALAGRWASGRVPLGYCVDQEKKLHLDPAAAPIIKQIFTRYAGGEKIADIARWLKSIHFKTALGKDFGRSSFHRMFNNRVYIGEFRWSNISLPGAVPAIVSPELFASCQIRMNNNKNKTKEGYAMPSDIYLLTGKIKCGCCGGPMVGISGNNKYGKTYYYYACQNTRNQRTKCDTGYLSKEDIENAVVDKAIAILSNPENVDLIAEQAMKFNAAAENEQLNILLMQEKDLQTKINNCVKAIEQGVISSTIANNLQQYESELQEIKTDIAKERLLQNPVLITKQHIAFFLTRFKTMAPNKAKAYILNTLLDTVSVKKQNDGNYLVTVTYNYNDSPNLKNHEKYSIHADSDGVRKPSHWWR